MGVISGVLLRRNPHATGRIPAPSGISGLAALAVNLVSLIHKLPGAHMAHQRTHLLVAVIVGLCLAFVSPRAAVGGSVRSLDAAAGHMTPSVSVSPKVVSAGAVRAGRSAFDCEVTSPPTCYSPRTIRTSYGFDKLGRAGLDGRGRTIVIVDAYSNPKMASDLATFNRLFKLPPAQIRQIAPDGLSAFDAEDGDQLSWSGEIALDVEWAHAIAPAAKIVLVLARSDSDPDIISAVRFAVDHNLGDVVSMSFYETETCLSSTNFAAFKSIFARGTQRGMTFLAASGDIGASAFPCDENSDEFLKAVSMPASDPLVTGVGGTDLRADPRTGRYLKETVWNEQFGATGGGVSVRFARPGYQSAAAGKGRAVPDVSYYAGGGSGVLVVWGEWGSGADAVVAFTGTSVGAPQWAALVSLVDQAAHRRVGLINDDLYRVAARTGSYRAAFHDVTVGNNSYNDGADTVLPGFKARTGYDLTTGLGSPKADVLVPILAGTSRGR
jgi:subtilase family serine protease